MTAAVESELELTRHELGTGVYAIADLRRLVAVAAAGERSANPAGTLAAPDLASSSRERIGYWLKAALNPVPHRRWAADYSFSDLISLLVVRELVARGVRLYKIKEAEDWMRKDLGLDRPFLRDDIKTDGVEVFYRDGIVAGQIEAASRRGQQAIREAIKDRLTGVRYTDGRASSWTPAVGVVLDPRIQFGEPVVKGTRVPTQSVAAIARSRGVQTAADDLAIPIETARFAVEFEDRLASTAP